MLCIFHGLHVLTVFSASEIQILDHACHKLNALRLSSFSFTFARMSYGDVLTLEEIFFKHIYIYTYTCKPSLRKKVSLRVEGEKKYLLVIFHGI